MSKDQIDALFYIYAVRNNLAYVANILSYPLQCIVRVAKKGWATGDLPRALSTFPGAGIDDMFHYVRPTVSTRPDEILLHIGTNDLKNKSPETFARSVVNLGNSIKRENNEIKLTLSSIINRSDDAFLEEKVKQYNELLVDLCSTNKWDLIDNNNINHSHLNNYGLHLNRKGTGALAKNIKHYLINN